MDPSVCWAVRGGSCSWRRGQCGSCRWVFAVAGWGEVCQELIEFVLPEPTLGPVAYQATSPGALQTDLPLLGHLISPSPRLQMSTPSSAAPPQPPTYPVWSGSEDVALRYGFRNCHENVFLTHGGLENVKDIKNWLPLRLGFEHRLELVFTWNGKRAEVARRAAEDVGILVQRAGSSHSRNTYKLAQLDCALTTLSSNIQFRLQAREVMRQKNSLVLLSEVKERQVWDEPPDHLAG